MNVFTKEAAVTRVSQDAKGGRWGHCLLVISSFESEFNDAIDYEVALFCLAALSHGLFEGCQSLGAGGPGQLPPLSPSLALRGLLLWQLSETEKCQLRAAGAEKWSCESTIPPELE